MASYSVRVVTEKELHKELGTLLEQLRDKTVCVIGTKASGKTTIAQALSLDEAKGSANGGFDAEAFRKMVIKPGRPLVSPVVVPCDVLIYIKPTRQVIKHRLPSATPVEGDTPEQTTALQVDEALFIAADAFNGDKVTFLVAKTEEEITSTIHRLSK